VGVHDGDHAIAAEEVAISEPHVFGKQGRRPNKKKKE
jgi:hypothetical protein